MSFDGHVLCQRMLIGPWALTIVGAATAAAAPAAAVFRKRRGVEVLSLDGAVMVFSPFDAGPVKGPTVIYCLQHKGLRQCLARMIGQMRRLDAGGWSDERNSPGRGIKREVRSALCHRPASAMRRIPALRCAGTGQGG